MERNSVPTTSQPSTSGTRVSSTAQNGTGAPLATNVGYPIVQNAQPRGAPPFSIPHVMDRLPHPPAGRPANPYNTGRVLQFGGGSSAFRPILPSLNGQQGVGRPFPFGHGQQGAGRPFPFGNSQQGVSRPFPFGDSQQGVGRPFPFGNSQQGVGRPFPFGHSQHGVTQPLTLNRDQQQMARPLLFSTPQVNGWGSTAQGGMRPNQAQYHPSSSCPYHRCTCFICPCPCHPRTPRL